MLNKALNIAVITRLHSKGSNLTGTECFGSTSLLIRTHLTAAGGQLPQCWTLRWMNLQELDAQSAETASIKAEKEEEGNLGPTSVLAGDLSMHTYTADEPRAPVRHPESPA